MQSYTYGNVTMYELATHIREFYESRKMYETPFEITIGTDSQNFSDTKIVSVIAARSVRHGGIFFYDIHREDRIDDVRQKLNTETSLSLEIANEFMNILEKNEEFHELYLNSHFAIHVDAGKSEFGKTKELIPGIIGWVKACGYDCVVKPDSYASSCVADKLSK